MMAIAENIKSNPYDELYRRKLTDVEVAEAKQNLAGLYGLLLRIDKQIKNERQSDDRSNGNSNCAD